MLARLIGGRSREVRRGGGGGEAKRGNWKGTRSINDPARTNLFLNRVTRLPSSPQFVRKATRHRGHRQSWIVGNERTNERLCTLARWQNIGPGVWGRVGAFVEERFFEGRIGMVNGFADWVVAGDTWWIPEHRGVWRNLPGRPVIRALTLFVPPFSFFFSSAWPEQLLEKLKIYHPMDIKKNLVVWSSFATFQLP